MSKKTVIIIVIICAVISIAAIAISASITASRADEATETDTAVEESSTSSSDSGTNDASDANSGNTDSVESEDENTTDVPTANENITDADKLASLLVERPFESSSGNNYLVFSEDNTYIYSFNGTVTTGSYSLSDVSVEELAADDETITRYTATIDVIHGRGELTADIAEGEKSIGVISTIVFTGVNVWLATDVASLEVHEPMSELKTTLGSSLPSVEKCVKQYCSEQAPTATGAWPLSTITVDYEQNTLTVGYLLTPVGGPTLYVTYDGTTDTCTAERASK